MKLTQSDVEKIKEEIEHRKLVVRPEAIEAQRSIGGSKGGKSPGGFK